jgi:hypothetical protein
MCSNNKLLVEALMEVVIVQTVVKVAGTKVCTTSAKVYNFMLDTKQSLDAHTCKENKLELSMKPNCKY